MKCGSPIYVYPPDDVHSIASRDRSSFLKVVESIGVCSKCNEVTRLYWGKPVAYRPLILLVRQLRGSIGRALTGLVSLGGRGMRGRAKTVEPFEMSDAEKEDVQARVRDYITENEGAIALSKAAEDLGIPVEFVREAIDKLTSEGRLKQAGDNEAAAGEASGP
jgi:hypothetical protein